MRKRVLVVLAALVIAPGVSTPAEASTIFATIPSADFSVPGDIGTFFYALPADSVVTTLRLGSSLYTFPAAEEAFGLEWHLDEVGALALVLQPEDTQFWMGSDITFLVPYIAWDGSLDLSAYCFLGTCPSSFTFDSTDPGYGSDWVLQIGFETQAVPEPTTTILLLGIGLAALARVRRRSGN